MLVDVSGIARPFYPIDPVSGLPLPVATPAGSAGTLASPTAVLNSRPFIAKGAIANTAGAAYAGGQPIGTVMTISGLGAGNTLNAPRVFVRANQGDVNGTFGSIFAMVFDGAPSGSAYTDKTAPAPTAADRDKIATSGNSTPILTAGTWLAAVNTSGRVAADASGNIYLLIVSNAATTFNNANAVTFEIDGLY